MRKTTTTDETFIMNTFVDLDFSNISSVRPTNKQATRYTLQNFCSIPLHSTSLGPGSHSPFPIHIVVLGPMRTYSGGQTKVTVAPSVAGSMCPIIIIKRSSDVLSRNGWPYVTIG